MLRPSASPVDSTGIVATVFIEGALAVSASVWVLGWFACRWSAETPRRGGLPDRRMAPTSGRRRFSSPVRWHYADSQWCPRCAWRFSFPLRSSALCAELGDGSRDPTCQASAPVNGDRESRPVKRVYEADVETTACTHGCWTAIRRYGGRYSGI